MLTQTGETIHAVHDLDGNRLAEYDYDASTGSSTLIRQYVWMEGRVVAVVEGGQVFFLRTDHIGRPVFATNELGGGKVWEANYLPFGGVHIHAVHDMDGNRIAEYLYDPVTLGSTLIRQ